MRWWRLLFIALLVVVAVFALLPAPPQRLSTGWDKLNHGLAFAALTLSGWLGHAGSRSKLAIVLIALLAYGGLIEIVQMFVPNRLAEWGDFVANSAGVACGALLASAARRLAAPVTPTARTDADGTMP